MSELPDTHHASPHGVPLLDNETVLKHINPSWLLWWKSIALAIFTSAFGMIGVGLGEIGASLPFVMLGLGLGGVIVLSRRRSRYVITTERVYKKIGLLRRTTTEARIADIHSLSTQETLLERILGQGTVRIDSTGISGLVSLSGTEDHEQFAQTIRRQQQQRAD